MIEFMKKKIKIKKSKIWKRVHILKILRIFSYQVHIGWMEIMKKKIENKKLQN